jgi:MFS transporter, SET family, sugar efflux transporter
VSDFVVRARLLFRHPSFRRLLLLDVLQGISTSFVAPFMSMFGTLEVRMSLLRFGTFMTLNAASGIVISTVLAHYSDWRFSRRAVLLFASLAGCLGYAGFAYLRSFWWLVAVGSIALGVASVIFSQLFAYARELLTESDADPALSAFYINVFRMAVALAWTVGPAVASFILVRFSYRGLFLGAAADLALFAAVVWYGVPATRPRASLPRTPSSQSLLALLVRGDVLSHFAAFVLVTASTTIGMMNLPLFIVKTLRGSEADVGVAYSVAPVFELPFMLYFGWLATRHMAARIMRVGMLVTAVYYTALCFVTAPWHVDLCQALAAASTAVISGVAITYFQSHLPNYPGTATNLYVTAQRIGSTAGYFLFVGLMWRFGHRAVFEACALFAVLGLALMLVPVHVTTGDPLPRPSSSPT